MSETALGESETPQSTCALSVRVAVDELNRLRALVRQQPWLRVDLAVAEAVVQLLDCQVSAPQVPMEMDVRVSKVYTVRIPQGLAADLRRWSRERGCSIGRAVDYAIRRWSDAQAPVGNAPVPRDLRRRARARTPRDWFVILDDEEGVHASV